VALKSRKQWERGWKREKKHAATSKGKINYILPLLKKGLGNHLPNKQKRTSSFGEYIKIPGKEDE